MVASIFRSLRSTGTSFASTCTHLSSPRNGSSCTRATKPAALPPPQTTLKIGSQGSGLKPCEARKPIGCPLVSVSEKSMTLQSCTQLSPGKAAQSVLELQMMQSCREGSQLPQWLLASTHQQFTLIGEASLVFDNWTIVAMATPPGALAGVPPLVCTITLGRPTNPPVRSEAAALTPVVCTITLGRTT
jgi:hypothetical protein